VRNLGVFWLLSSLVCLGFFVVCGFYASLSLDLSGLVLFCRPQLGAIRWVPFLIGLELFGWLVVEIDFTLLWSRLLVDWGGGSRFFCFCLGFWLPLIFYFCLACLKLEDFSLVYPSSMH